jgi:hypothetical protein
MNLTNTNLFLLGFPKCGTTAVAQWLDLSAAVELSSPKETYHFCPEFNSIHPREEFPGYRTDARYKVEACTWNIFSQQLLDELSQRDDVKVIILTRDIGEVAVSWFHQLKKAGLIHKDKSIGDLWGKETAFGAALSGKDILTDIRSCLTQGWWVQRWVQALSDERVLICNVDKVKGVEMRRRMTTFLDAAEDLPEVIEEKNVFSVPRNQFLYRTLRRGVIKRCWYRLEHKLESMRRVRVYIRERFLLKKAKKSISGVEFIVSDVGIVEDQKLLDDMLLRNEHVWGGR